VVDLRERQHVGWFVFAAPAVVQRVHHRVRHQEERQLGTLEVKVVEQASGGAAELAGERWGAAAAHGDVDGHG
jgi:hypothetical protein